MLGTVARPPCGSVYIVLTSRSRRPEKKTRDGAGARASSDQMKTNPFSIALLALAACGPSSSAPAPSANAAPAPSSTEPAVSGDEVACDASAPTAHRCISQSCAAVPAEWTTCSTASDCVSVSLAECECDAAGRQVSVNTAYRARARETYTGDDGEDPNCDCTCGDLPVACVAGRCGFDVR
jgi:hypothetical protein